MKDEDIWTFAWYLIVLAILALCWRPASDALADRLTAYPAVCEDASANDAPAQCGKWKAAEAAIFTVQPAQQLVVVKRSGSIARLSDCVVLDRLNWECSEYVAADGKVVRPWFPVREIFVPRWRWYLMRLGL